MTDLEAATALARATSTALEAGAPELDAARRRGGRAG